MQSDHHECESNHSLGDEYCADDYESDDSAQETEENAQKVGNISKIGDNESITKQIIKLGVDSNHPKLQSQVKCLYKGYFVKSGIVFDQASEPVILVVGDPLFIERFKIGIQTMKKNEKAIFTIKA